MSKEANKMAYESKFTTEDVNELLADDLSIAASLATLIIEGGDIRAFLIMKLEAREEELATFHLSQEPRWMDDLGFKESLGILSALGRPKY
jgi:hypothetical protein